MGMRLDRALSGATSLTRSQIKKHIAAGEVLVNEQAVRRPETPVDPQRDIIRLLGERVSLSPAYLMLNKPRGVVSATRDAKERTVLDLVPEHLQRKNLFPAGRLDRDTEGFVLITDDGDFAHRILAPKRHVPKTYIAEVEGPLDPDTDRQFAQGVRLGDGTLCHPAGYRLLDGPREDGSVCVEVVLTQGMYHQIKRMFAACGGRVTALRRTKIGALVLDPELGPGECREILPEELELVTNWGWEAYNALKADPFLSKLTYL